MFRKAASVLVVLVAFLGVTAFRMPQSGASSADAMLFDVRGIFVTVAQGVSPELARDVEQRLKSAVQATVRREVLPRVVVSVKIDEVQPVKWLFGVRYKTKFTVKAASVINGSVIAAGVYSARTANPSFLPDKIARTAGRALSLAPPSGMSVAMAIEAALQ
ncbi:MAG: hypothetical protein LCH47_07990 [Proteobacteria bacterium]|nr:hypothetical protein [Pseudomonadota bacterium]